MIEIPEAIVLAGQVSMALAGKEIREVVPLHSPHKFAWFHGDPGEYPGRLEGRKVERGIALGGMVAIVMGEVRLLLSDGVVLRYHEDESGLPKKHQLLLGFTDGTFLSMSVQMYGGIVCFRGDEYDGNPYYRGSKEKPSPLSDDFSPDYFRTLIERTDPGKLSAKAFLATEQRIPGLGNGVLQDILFHARIHPRRKMDSVMPREMTALFSAIETTLKTMTDRGGRDTEKDLFGSPGGYRSILSRNTAGTPCPECGSVIEKASYMGGSVYFCPRCQRSG